MDAQTLNADVPEDVDEAVRFLMEAKLAVKTLPKSRETAIAITKIEEAMLWLIGFAAIQMTDEQDA